jgi:hypothetical protein
MVFSETFKKEEAFCGYSENLVWPQFALSAGVLTAHLVAIVMENTL